MAAALLMKVWKAANNLHVALYRMSGGKFANKVANLPVLLITTSGRKTGKPHTNAVVYIKDSEDYLVSASNGGADRTPSWYLNLESRPQARIEVGNAAFSVEARITESEERTQLYERFKTASGNFVKYEKSAGRMIPVIRLTPAQG